MERATGRCPAGEFLDGVTPGERAKLDVIFQLLGDRGHLRNRTKFKKLQDSIWEVKSGQIRIFCFFHSSQLILVFAVRKKADAHARKDIRKAIDMRLEYLGTQGGGR